MPIKFLNDVAVDTSVLYVDTINNRVGIGTASPGAKLDVVGSARFNNLLATNSTNGAAKAFIHVASSAGAAKFKVYKNVNTTDGYAYFRIDRAYDYGNNDQMIQEAVYQRRTTTKNVKFKYEGDVATTDDVYLEFYELTDGTVEAWICHDDYAQVGVSITYFESTGDTYPTPSAGTPTGTLIHSTNPDTETPNWDSYQGDGYFAGNVGIGTTSPDAKLDIEGDEASLRIKDTTSGKAWDWQIHAGYMEFGEVGVANNRLVIRNGGNVGIGTTSPTQLLHVSGNARVTGAYYDSNNSPGTINQVLLSTVTGTDWIDGTAIPGLVDGTGTANYVARWIGTESIGIGVIYDNGTNVGIGTTSPGEKLTLQTQATGLGSEGVFIKNPFAGSTPIVNSKSPFLSLATSNSSGYTSTIYMGRNGTATGQESKIEWSNSNNGLSIYVAGQGSYREHVRFGNISSSVARTYFNGNVGIGTTSPSYKLDVNGTGRFAGDVSVEDNLYLTDAGTVRGKIQLNSSDRDDLDIKAVSLGSNMKFFTVDTERMRIDSSGKVMIGSTNPGTSGTIDLSVGSTSSSGGITLWSPTNSAHSIGFGDGYTGTDRYRGYLEYLHASDSMRFGTSATERMRINSSGNVGIGTTSPDSKLHIVNPDGGSYRFGYGGSSDVYFDSDTVYFRTDNGGANLMTSTVNGLGIGTTSPTTKLHVHNGEATIASATDGVKLSYSNGNSSGIIDTAFSDNNLEFRTNGTARMFITNAGNVGIGTTSPGHLLEVHGTADALSVGDDSNTTTYARFANDRTYFGYLSSGNAFVQGGTSKGISFHTGSSTVGGGERMRINSSGNVGIGTTSPAAKLDINDSSNDVSLTNTANYAINTGSAISVRHYRNVNLETPKMQWSVGGSTDLNWKKLATIVINDQTYSGFGAEVEITDFQGNYGSSMAQYGDVYKGGLSIYHRAGTGVEPEQGIITINNDIAPYIRIYKIAGSGNSSYQIQVKSPGNYRQVHVKLEQGNGNGVASITPHANNTNGSTSGGTAYTPDAYTNANQFKTAFPTVAANRGFILDKLGIGTTSPGEKLAVSGGNIEIADSTGGRKIGFDVSDSISFNSTTIAQYGMSNAGNSEAGGITYSGFFGQKFFTNGAQRMVIQRYGNVGIGTTSPVAKLEVEGGDHLLQVSSLSATGNPYISFNQAGTRRSFIQHNDSGDYLKLASEYGGISFFTGTGGTETQKMTILSGGNVGIATTTPTETLEVGGTILAGSTIYSGSTSVGFFNTGSYFAVQATNGMIVRDGSTYKPVGASAFTVVSDYRLKSNIEPLENATSRLKQLEVHRFNWNDRLDEPKVDGFIAHEVAPIIPEAVLGEKDAVHEDGTPKHQGIDQAKLVPLLTAALQEAITKIENLESRIQTLENQ